jgi:phosphocarrier protein HPr
MGLMLLAAGRGSKLKLTATGLDADAAAQALEALVQSKFNEE